MDGGTSTLTGRNHSQHLQRTPGLRKGPWDSDEDKQLVARVSSGVENWADISDTIEGRT